MRNSRTKLLVFVYITAIIMSCQIATAEVGDPRPVSDGTKTFRSHENYVEAVDSSSGTVLWRTVLYKRVKPLVYNPFLEEDVQWNIITSLSLEGDVLTVMNKKGSIYFLNPQTGTQAREPILKSDWFAIVVLGSLIVVALLCAILIVKKMRSDNHRFEDIDAERTNS